MNKTILLLLVFWSTALYSQTSEELQGKWQFIKVEFSGPDAKKMNEDGPNQNCLQMQMMEFSGNEVTTYLYFDEACKEMETETFPFKMVGAKLEFWNNYQKKWNASKIKRYTVDSFMLEQKEEDLTTAITLKRI